MKRSLILFMIVGLISGSVATAKAEETFGRDGRTVVASYYGAQSLNEYRSCAVSGGAGCVALPTLAYEQELTGTVTDAHGLPVLVWVVDASERQDDVNGPNRVYGRFCGETTGAIEFEPGAELELWIGSEWWPTWWIVPQVKECNPSSATTGTVRVTLSGWTPSEDPGSSSSGPDDSPSEEPSPSDRPEYVERSVDLALRRHLRGIGSVVAANEFCRSGVPVVIQRKTPEAWVAVASTTTDADGRFAVRLTDRPGRFRALASEVAATEITCLAAASATVRHQH